MAARSLVSGVLLLSTLVVLFLSTTQQVSAEIRCDKNKPTSPLPQDVLFCSVSLTDQGDSKHCVSDCPVDPHVRACTTIFHHGTAAIQLCDVCRVYEDADLIALDVNAIIEDCDNGNFVKGKKTYPGTGEATVKVATVGG
ncbi:unnamed protein product [Calypogeia fissa]